MSHAEIWDDSALVDSWNDALEEYKHYHSLHARGERAEDVLKSHDTQASLLSLKNSTSKESSKQEVMDQAEGRINEGDYVEGEADIEDKVETKPPQDQFDTKHFSVDQAADPKRRVDKMNAGPPLPQHLIGSVQDENLKNLLMSWYYAGYYTGLYEGQQATVAK